MKIKPCKFNLSWFIRKYLLRKLPVSYVVIGVYKLEITKRKGNLSYLIGYLRNI